MSTSNSRAEGFRAKLRADAEWYFRSWKKPKPGIGTWLRLILLTPGYQLVISIRVQEKLGRIPKLGVVLRRILWYMTTQYFNSDIDPQARFGPGLYLPHPICVVVGAEVRAGRDVVILQGTTLGRRGEPDGHLVIGDDVQIGSGAKVLGVITIGKGARIGANAVVLKSVPENAVAVGIPARIVAKTQSTSPVPTLETL